MTLTNRRHLFFAAGTAGIIWLAASVFAEVPQPVPVQEISSQEEIVAALTGGVPGERWKEGLLYEGIRPTPWMKSASNWFPRTEEIQEPFVREQQIDPASYYPEGYYPEPLETWPVDGDLVVPIELLPENLRKSMGAEWRLRMKNQKVLEEQDKN